MPVNTGRSPGRLARWAGITLAVVFAAATASVQIGPAIAADNPYQRGPDPTRSSVAASRGTFATAQVGVPAGNGFGGGVIYYPTDTSQGTFGAVAIVPGYTAKWAAEGAWTGPWLASFGLVVIGIDTNSANDFDVARDRQLPAALDYLAQRGSVRGRVDTTRLAAMGHSMGGGGALNAALRRPSSKAAVGSAPYKPSGNLASDRVATLLLAGQNDTTVTPSYVDGLHRSIPATTEKGYVELSGAGHAFPTRANSTQMRVVTPWLKVFLDDDARYSQFLCPLMDSAGINRYGSTCPLLPPDGSTGSSSSLVGSGFGKCLDAGAGQDRSKVTITSCTGGGGQKWVFNTNGTITDPQSGRCLDVDARGTADNTAVATWTCHGESNQVWTRRA